MKVFLSPLLIFLAGLYSKIGNALEHQIRKKAMVFNILP